MQESLSLIHCCCAPGRVRCWVLGVTVVWTAGERLRYGEYKIAAPRQDEAGPKLCPPGILHPFVLCPMQGQAACMLRSGRSAATHGPIFPLKRQGSDRRAPPSADAEGLYVASWAVGAGGQTLTMVSVVSFILNTASASYPQAATTTKALGYSVSVRVNLT